MTHFNHTPEFHSRGFTLVELMVTITVLAILASIAVPSMSTFFEKRRLIDAAEQFYGHISEARSLAISRNRDIYMRFATQNSGENWQYTLSQNSGCDMSITNPAQNNANACVIVTDDGDGVIDDGTATIDDDDVFLYRFTDADHSTVKMTINTVPNFVNQITFDPSRGIIPDISGAHMVVTLSSDQNGFELRLRISKSGRVRLCSPSGSTNVPGYPSDDCGT